MSHILDIIIKATDQASATTKKVEQSIKGIENTTKGVTTSATGKFETFKNKVGGVASKIKAKWNNMSHEMKLAIGGALTGAGLACMNFLRTSITTAKEAQKGWIAYKNAYQVVTHSHVTNTDTMKQAVVDLANTTGRTTSDTRTALTQLMNKGLSFAQAQKAAYAASGIAAAGLAQDEASASTMIIQALNGRGMALKKLGLDINDYKDKATGQIDTERLLMDITNKTKGAQEEYANSSEAVANRLDNSMASLKTSIGSVALQALEPMVRVLAQVVGAFNRLPGPVKTASAVTLMMFTAFTMLAGPLTSVIELLTLLGVINETTTISTIAHTVAENARTVATTAVTAAQWALNAAMNANPIGIVILAVVALSAALLYLYNNNETVRNAVNALASVLKGTVVSAFNTVMKVVNKVTGVFKTLYNTFTTAKSKASSMVSGIVGYISSLPGKIAAEFGKIPQRIKQAIKDAMNAAFGYGSILFNAVMDALGIHSPGFIQENIAKEFMDTGKRILKLTGSAKKAGQAYGEAIMGGFGDSGFSLDTDLSRNSRLSVNHTVTVDHDFSNLPSGVSASEVARIVNKTATTKEFANNLTSNLSFQNKDIAMKSRLSSKQGRARGA